MTNTISVHITQDAIAGHKAAIAKLEQSIAARNERFQCAEFIEFLAPNFLLAMNRIHLKEVADLEILRLELNGIKEFEKP